MSDRLMDAVRYGLGCVGFFYAVSSAADTLSVAVAANFSATLQKLAVDFERDSGHRLIISSASTGKLYTQIRQGAPYQVFLSADTETPTRLEAEGLAVPGTRFTYAVGQLALWSANPKLIGTGPEVLSAGRFKHLALANPKLAPYGQAAVQTLDKLGLTDRLKPRWVLGDNIAQTHQFIQSGNAELGFVALSQLMGDGRMGQGVGAGSVWRVPPSLHQALNQDAIVLKSAQDMRVALSFLQYLRSPKARDVMEKSGYGV